MCRNKRSVAVNLKHSEGTEVVKKLCADADVLMEGFRPGVMEKLGLGPDVMLEINPKLIYAQLTGYGQSGSLAYKVGHDINYLAISGILSVSYSKIIALKMFDSYKKFYFFNNHSLENTNIFPLLVFGHIPAQ